MQDANLIEQWANTYVLGALLDAVRTRCGSYELLDHWKQGEFHHDVVVRLGDGDPARRGRVLVVATNCNGGVKEVLLFDAVPDRSALWHWRCPTNAEFAGSLTPPLAEARTSHFFDPCELLVPDARSELLPQFRARQPGGGWQMCGAPKGEPRSKH